MAGTSSTRPRLAGGLLLAEQRATAAEMPGEEAADVLVRPEAVSALEAMTAPTSGP